MVFGGIENLNNYFHNWQKKLNSLKKLAWVSNSLNLFLRFLLFTKIFSYIFRIFFKYLLQIYISAISIYYSFSKTIEGSFAYFFNYKKIVHDYSQMTRNETTAQMTRNETIAQDLLSWPHDFLSLIRTFRRSRRSTFPRTYKIKFLNI